MLTALKPSSLDASLIGIGFLAYLGSLASLLSRGLFLATATVGRGSYLSTYRARALLRMVCLLPPLPRVPAYRRVINNLSNGLPCVVPRAAGSP